IVTALDPRFTIAYRFGAVFLAEAYPRGAARPDLAIKLLEKGLAQRPDKWEYMEDIGFVHYWFNHDFRSAARWFDRAASVPGAPAWLRPLAAATLAQGGDRRSSRVMWEAIRASAEVDWLRQSAERRLAQLQALDTIESLQRVVDDYVTRTGQPPDWTALARARVLPGIPLDPTGVPFELTHEGRVVLSRRSSLWPPPEEPAGLARPAAVSSCCLRGVPWRSAGRLAPWPAASSTSSSTGCRWASPSCGPRPRARIAAASCRGTKTFRS